MVFSLAIQNTYQVVEYALVRDGKIIQKCALDKTVASKSLIPELQLLLTAHAVSYADLSYIAVNQGPGPFTTLKVVIATVNGIGFATLIPLVGVDGLDALVQEYKTVNNNVVVLLNAFAHDVYYALAFGNATVQKGYENNASLIAKIVTMMPQEPMIFVGNGTSLYRELIYNQLGSRAIFIDDGQSALLQQIIMIGQTQWQAGAVSKRLMPLYLKRAFHSSSGTPSRAP